MFVYDELERRQLENRAATKDPILDKNQTFGRVDKSPFSLARQRLDTALRQAGLQPKLSRSSGSAAAVIQEADQVVTALKHQKAQALAAGEAMRGKKGDKRPADRDLPWMRGGSSTETPNHGGGSQHISACKAKKNEWWTGKKAYWKQMKKGGGGYR